MQNIQLKRFLPAVGVGLMLLTTNVFAVLSVPLVNQTTTESVGTQNTLVKLDYLVLPGFVNGYVTIKAGNSTDVKVDGQQILITEVTLLDQYGTKLMGEKSLPYSIDSGVKAVNITCKKIDTGKYACDLLQKY